MRNHAYWCTTGTGSRLEPNLKAVHKHFKIMENMSSCFSHDQLDPDIVDAGLECKNIHDCLDLTALHFIIRRGSSRFGSSHIVAASSIDRKTLELTIAFHWVGISREFSASRKLSEYTPDVPRPERSWPPRSAGNHGYICPVLLPTPTATAKQIP